MGFPVPKKKALDLFCGAGGATKGLQQAGFYVVGVDIQPQPRYCGDEFFQADALTFPLEGYDFIWASPPCQHYSCATPINYRQNHPDLVDTVRNRLVESGAAWVIENVPGAPLKPTLVLCGCLFGLKILRKRLFETSWDIFQLIPPCHHPETVINTVRSQHGPWFEENGRVATRREIADAMGVSWMDTGKISQAIPPAYSEFIGRQVMEYLEA